MMRRRQARELALKSLYSAYQQGLSPLEVLERIEELTLGVIPVKEVEASGKKDSDFTGNEKKPDRAGEEESADVKSDKIAEDIVNIDEYARRLITILEDKAENLDPVIEALSENWEISRMPVIDRLILRMGIGELLFMPDIPRKVTINEMVELGKKYSTEKSGQFINGILDKVETGRNAAGNGENEDDTQPRKRFAG